jgi:hypothetical protein
MMTTALALLVAAGPTDLPPLTDLDRFPSLDACQARIRALLEKQLHLQLAPKSPERDNALRLNSYRLNAWGWLLAARGGLVEEEGNDDSEETRRGALEELHRAG